MPPKGPASINRIVRETILQRERHPAPFPFLSSFSLSFRLGPRSHYPCMGRKKRNMGHRHHRRGVFFFFFFWADGGVVLRYVSLPLTHCSLWVLWGFCMLLLLFLLLWFGGTGRFDLWRGVWGSERVSSCREWISVVRHLLRCLCWWCVWGRGEGGNGWLWVF